MIIHQLFFIAIGYLKLNGLSMKQLFSTLICLSMLLVISDCTNSNQRDKLIGEWRSLSIDVTMKTVNGSDSTGTFLANQDNWVDKLGIQPIRTFYNRDGSYVSKYYAPNDSLIRENSGNWKIKNDSLYLYQTNPDSMTYVSKFSMQNDTARFEMTLDWDQDGSKDDYYIGIQKKYSD